MFNILLVEDEVVTSRIITSFLQKHGHHVVNALSLIEATIEINHNTFDLIIIDRKLPDGDGLEVIDVLRERKSLYSTGIVIVSSLGSTSNIIDALKRGADDYLTKPINTEELLFRINAVLGRIKFNLNNTEVTSPKKNANNNKQIKFFHEFALCTKTRFLKKDNLYDVPLTDGEFKVLTILVDNQGLPVSRSTLLQINSNREITEDSRTIDVIIGRLRKKLNDLPSEPKLLLTVRGKGYMIPHLQ